MSEITNIYTIQETLVFMLLYLSFIVCNLKKPVSTLKTPRCKSRWSKGKSNGRKFFKTIISVNGQKNRRRILSEFF